MAADYTIAAIVAPVAVLAVELLVVRTGILRQGRYWATVALVLAFQVPVDGLLTRGPAPVVAYRDAAISGLRVGWNIPVEDFGFGFALVTLTIMVWVCRHSRERRDA